MKKSMVISSLTIKRNSKSNLLVHIRNLLYGLIGFLSFLSIIISVKLLEHIFSQTEFISVDGLDILLSALGFIMIFVFKEFAK
jgi:hypothetical protein